jgi:hypothetical protein
MIQDMMDENLKHRGVDDGAWVILYRDRANVSRKDSRPLFFSPRFSLLIPSNFRFVTHSSISTTR